MTAGEEGPRATSAQGRRKAQAKATRGAGDDAAPMTGGVLLALGPLGIPASPPPNRPQDGSHYGQRYEINQGRTALAQANLDRRGNGQERTTKNKETLATIFNSTIIRSCCHR